ncbi:MAG: restriction endonuclease [Betaproteobacteria bacterium]
MSELNSDPVEFVTLGELTDKPVDQTGPLSDFIYIDISCIDRESKKIIDPKNVLLSEAPSRAKQVLKDGDILVSMTRPNLNAVAFVPSHLDGAIGSTGFHVLRSSWLHPRYLLALVQTNDFVDAMSAVVQGALYPAVRPRDIAAYSLRFETPKHQTRIVEKLEELLTGLDAGVAELKAAQKKLAQYRQSLLKAAVEGALTAQWRVNNSPTETGAQLLERILQERRARWEAKQLAKFKEQGKAPPKDWQKKYPEPVQPDTTDLPEFPHGWGWGSFEQLFDALSDSGKKLPQAAYAQAGLLPVIDQGAQFIGGYTDDVSLLFDGALPVIGFGDHTRRFKLIQNPFVVGADGLKLISISSAWIPDFAFIACSTLDFEDRGYSRHFQFIRNASFSLPPLAEQNEIVVSVAARLKENDDISEAIELALKQSAAQRQNILKAAFSGQLVPQDPSDEPASELLARIRAERAVQQAVKKPRGRKVKEAA